MPTEASLKALWRYRTKSRLDLLRPGESAQTRNRLRENVTSVVMSRPGLWAAYRPLPLEADPLVDPIPGVEWVYPRLVGDALEFRRGGAFVKGRFGLEEPDASSEIVAPEELTGVLVPGLAFDRQGGRLGRGRGFYDRTLAPVRGCLVGVAYSLQLVECVPAEPWDLRMDAVVTEQSVTWCGGWKWKW